MWVCEVWWWGGTCHLKRCRKPKKQSCVNHFGSLFISLVQKVADAFFKKFIWMTLNVVCWQGLWECSTNKISKAQQAQSLYCKMLSLDFWFAIIWWFGILLARWFVCKSAKTWSTVSHLYSIQQRLYYFPSEKLEAGLHNFWCYKRVTNGSCKRWKRQDSHQRTRRKSLTASDAIRKSYTC